MNPVFLPVTDISLKENIETLLSFRSKITTIDAKIETQNKEILKTVDIIEKFKTCYNQQTQALQKFNEEKNSLIKEYQTLLQNVQGISNEINCHIKSEIDFIAEQKIDENWNFDSLPIPDVRKVDVDDVDKSNINMDFSGDNNNPVSVNGSVLENPEKLFEPLIACVGDNLPAETQAPDQTTKKRLRRKSSSNDQLKSKNLKKKTKVLVDNKKLKSKKKKKAESPNQEAIVMMKVDTCPIKLLISLEQYQHSVINKIVRVGSDLFVCGSNGLLACHLKTGVIISYRGHEYKPVRDFYVAMGPDKPLVSLGQDSVLVHSLSNPNEYRCLTRFDSDICSSCVYKSKMYGCLGNGNLFVMDMTTDKVTVLNKGSRDRIVNMVVVKVNGNKIIITSSSDSTISSYSIDDKLNLVQRPTLGVVGDATHCWQGIVTYSSSVICYTRHAIFLLDKVQWRISLIKEITNDIHFLDADMHNIVVLDSYNILHKYIIKKGKIRLGSSIEYLKSPSKPTAMHYNHSAKKVYFAMGTHLYNQNF